jgi:hypothetical protein
MTHKLILAFCITLAFTQCCKKKPIPPNPATPLSPGVYIAGTIKEGNTVWPVYWKDGGVHKIGAGANIIGATCIAASENNLYVGGYTANAQGVEQAVYWRNDTLVKVNTQSAYSIINDIAVVGNDVYLFGSEGNSNGDEHLCYWKNDVKTILTATGAWTAGRMHVISGDVYTCGTQSTSVVQYGYAYKNSNTLFYDLYTSMSDIMFANGVVNVAGFEDNAGFAKPAVWKGTQRTSLPNLGSTGFGNSIEVAGTDVYVGGLDRQGINVVSTIWKNGIASPIISSPGYGEITSIKVNGTDVQACGNTSISNAKAAIYIKNNAATLLDPNKLYAFSSASDMVIVK